MRLVGAPQPVAYRDVQLPLLAARNKLAVGVVPRDVAVAAEVDPAR